MNGNITNICTNDYGNQTYGFILGEDGRDYFFHRNNLINCSIVRLQEGDPVEFTPELDQREPDKLCATNVRKRTTSSPTVVQYANPGIHRDVSLENSIMMSRQLFGFWLRPYILPMAVGS